MRQYDVEWMFIRAKYVERPSSYVVMLNTPCYQNNVKASSRSYIVIGRCHTGGGGTLCQGFRLRGPVL